ncbi:MAG: flavodoxin-dependent (E)-4-hydroxy-3-methylbut-2-enyl-diphosphate synthase, partial [Dehalococcoidales bacterium]|nr:flavodoxin-dependent (E)-4-hydroxy-3-methylbut-2-enyl-diphosphate synthase [Dehalococcoidales bacterium]
MTRRKSIQLHIGDVLVGGDAPITVQSMTKTDTRDVKATVRSISELEEAGCEIIRLAVPDEQAAEALADIRKQIRIPLVADIHFDYRLALTAIKGGVDALRLNPGNIGGRERTEAVVKAAKERNIPIRIGVNAGSLPKDLDESMSLPDRMVEAAMRHVRILEDLDFGLIKVSLKASDVPTTVRAYEKIAKLIPYPLHLGITEAGTSYCGVIRSSVGLGILLDEGIGDTIRVSLTADPVEEVRAGLEILRSLGLRDNGPKLISC